MSEVSQRQEAFRRYQEHAHNQLAERDYPQVSTPPAPVERLPLRDVIHQTGELLADCHSILDKLIGSRPAIDSNAPSPPHIIGEIEMLGDNARWSAKELVNRFHELSARL